MCKEDGNVWRTPDWSPVNRHNEVKGGGIPYACMLTKLIADEEH